MKQLFSGQTARALRNRFAAVAVLALAGLPAFAESPSEPTRLQAVGAGLSNVGGKLQTGVGQTITAVSESPVVQYVYSGNETGSAPVLGAVADPLQTYNRKMFAFNDAIDRYFLAPIARGYVAVTPKPIRTGVRNVFRNIAEVPSVANGLLQGDIPAAAYDTTRFIVNSTVGLGGIFDVAGHLELPANDYEDFGQTLAVWGFRSGPYIVLPIFGPSTIRDGIAKPVDWNFDPLTFIDHDMTSYSVKFANVVNIRAQLFPFESAITGDKYEFIRDAYLQRRAFLINNGETFDSFGDEDEFDLEDFE